MDKTQLGTSKLGGTGLEITRIGFGAWAIGGGGWEFGWGPQQDEEILLTNEDMAEIEGR
jgi:aryl-alcohol dehydrogenase-like predicted oxidoreductase